MPIQVFEAIRDGTSTLISRKMVYVDRDQSWMRKTRLCGLENTATVKRFGISPMMLVLLPQRIELAIRLMVEIMFEGSNVCKRSKHD